MEAKSQSSSSPAFNREIDRIQAYVSEHDVDDVVKTMLGKLFDTCPEDPIAFMISHLSELKQNNAPSELPVMKVEGRPRRRRMARRQGVSAEPVSMEEIKNRPTRVIPKGQADVAQIMEACNTQGNFLFSNLPPDAMTIVVDAMEKLNFEKGQTVIQQGDDGDSFYLVQAGTLECFISKQGDKTPPPGKLVRELTHGDSFGELALMYSSPRSATIIAKTPCTLWAMDRATFFKVMMTTTSEKRARHEGFLEKVPLLKGLTQYERVKLSDALEMKSFKKGQYIIKEGDTEDDRLYLLESGVASATKVLNDGENPTELTRYKVGDYFGELALLTDQPRSANVVAAGDCTVAALDRGTFTRLLGVCEDILKRKQGAYKH